MNNLLIVGDVHAHLDSLTEIINKYKDKIIAVLQVGDFELYQSEQAITQEINYLEKKNKLDSAKRLKRSLLKKSLEPFPVPVYYIKGNHEDFDNLDSTFLRHMNIHYLEQGETIKIGDRTVAGVGGIYSPVKNTKKSEDLNGHDKRFYTLEDVNKVLKKRQTKPIDILITHQACSGVIPEKSKKRYKPFWDEGTKDFVELLKMPKLRYYIHGHHHVNYRKTYNNIKCIGLGHFGKNKKSHIII